MGVWQLPAAFCRAFELVDGVGLSQDSLRELQRHARSRHLRLDHRLDRLRSTIDRRVAAHVAPEHVLDAAELLVPTEHRRAQRRILRAPEHAADRVGPIRCPTRTQAAAGGYILGAVSGAARRAIAAVTFGRVAPLSSRIKAQCLLTWRQRDLGDGPALASQEDYG